MSTQQQQTQAHVAMQVSQQAEGAGAGERPDAAAGMAVKPLVAAVLLGGVLLGGCSSNPARDQAAREQARAMAGLPTGKSTRAGAYPSAGRAAQTRAYPQSRGAAAQAAALDTDSVDSLEGLLEATDMEAVESNRLAILRHGDVWKRIKAGFRMNLAYQNSRINAQRNWFASRQTYLDRLSARASRYLYHTVTEAEKRGIPTELALLPVIESSYDPGATSNAAAAGLWQFIPSTGLLYGLKQTPGYDGRRDVVDSTRAAYDYLTSLYNKFGSWELALASYNAGPGRIQQAINRNAAAGLPTDYWSLRLPEETMNYVPRFLAVAQIVQNPEQHGVRLNPIANRPHFRQVALPGVVDLAQVGQITGLSSQEIYELNPAFRRGQTDPVAPGRLLVPNALSADIDTRLARMPTLGGYQASTAVTAPAVVRPVTVRPGISTSEAAALMGDTAAAARPALATTTAPARTALPRDASALAALANAGLTPGGAPKLAVPTSAVINVSTSDEPPLSAQEQALVRAAAASEATSGASLSESTRPAGAVAPVLVAASQAAVPRITVAPTSPAPSVSVPVASPKAVDGVAPPVVPNAEPALTAAEKAQVVAEIQSLAPAGTTVVDPLDGRIKLSAIQTQQSVLEAKGEERQVRYETVVPVTTAPSSAAARTAPAIKPVLTVKPAKPKGERTIYTVQAGDSLIAVARRFNVSPATLADWNQIAPTANLITGTPLYLYGVKPLPKPTTYVAQSGDSLTAVAARFGLTLGQLAAYNNLETNDNLLAGQKLYLTDAYLKPAYKAQIAEQAQKTQTASSPTRNNRLPDSDRYQIRSGDSLRSVAARYGITHTELARMNGLPSTADLQLGNRLNVPAGRTATALDDTDTPTRPARESTATATKKSRVATENYTVKPGDSLIGLAARHGISADELAELNSTDAKRNLLLGEKIRVPRRTPEAIDAAATRTERVEKKERRDNNPSNVYTIKSGETLTGLAARYGISVGQLAALNDIPPGTSVRAGDTLNVPTADDGTDRKPAKKSSRDSEADPAPATKDSKRATSKADKQKPDADPATATKSAKGSARTVSYTIKAGETLAQVAARHGMALSDLAQLNGIPAQTRIQTGDTLEIPASAKKR